MTSLNQTTTADLLAAREALTASFERMMAAGREDAVRAAARLHEERISPINDVLFDRGVW